MNTHNTTKRFLTLAASSVFTLSNLALNTVHADTLLGADLEVGLWSPSYDAGSSYFKDSNSAFSIQTLPSTASKGT